MNVKSVLTVTAWQMVFARRQWRRITYDERVLGAGQYWHAQEQAYLSVLRISLKGCPRKMRMTIGAEIRKELKLAVRSIPLVTLTRS